jgi:hypothetical protein
MPDWLGIAFQRSTMARGVKLAAVVGSLLVAINRGEAILAGNVDGNHLLRIGLTVLVPYAVSTFSTCGAKLEAKRQRHQ